MPVRISSIPPGQVWWQEGKVSHFAVIILRDRLTRACQHTVISLLIKEQGRRKEENKVRENLLRIEIHPLGSHSAGSKLLILHKLCHMIFHFPSWYMGNKSKKAWALKVPGCHFCPGSATGFEHCQGWPVLRSRTCEVQSKHLFSKELFLLSI